MRYSNLHTHTIFSDGRYTPEENVLEAVKRNMTSIGFSDHSYTDFDLRFGIRPQNTAAYVREIRRLQKKYKDELEIYLGIELDGFSKLENRELYDYIFIDSPAGLGTGFHLATCDCDRVLVVATNDATSRTTAALPCLPSSTQRRFAVIISPSLMATPTRLSP